jgi:hypothetical protein
MCPGNRKQRIEVGWRPDRFHVPGHRIQVAHSVLDPQPVVVGSHPP